MGLSTLLIQLFLVIIPMLVVASFVVVGPDRLRTLRREYRDRLRSVVPNFAILIAALAINRVARSVAPELSWLINWNITNLIFAIEGDLVADFQSMAAPPITAYFSFVYLFGYVFLLVFPVIGYLAMADPEPLKRLVTAYTINYTLGLILYILFIAYGPRNFMPESVDSLLYTFYPQSQFLTREVNTNTNVFPSLHSSLATTVAILAWQTRAEYPIWLPVAGIIAISILLSTMYLGIHWATDVVAGIGLAGGSVYLAQRWTTTSPTRKAWYGDVLTRYRN